MTKLKEKESPQFNLTVTSPPYNIGKEYETTMKPEAYVNWCREWIQLIHALTKDNGAFWLNLGYMALPNRGKCVPISYLIWEVVPFFLIQEVVWNYGAGVACKKYLSPRNEKLLWYVKNQDEYVFNLDEIRDSDVKYPNQRKKGVLKCNPNGKNPTDVWTIPKVTSGGARSSQERTEHPAQFPMKLIERVIKCSSNEGDLLLDPFMGSGSSAEVAIKLKRKVIGFEIKKEYCDIIVNRIKPMDLRIEPKEEVSSEDELPKAKKRKN
jgi:adenine-specific DNA-methyltransferase